MTRVKKWYLSIVEGSRRSFWESLFYFLLCFLSRIYGVGVFLRNFLYEIKVLPQFFSKAKVVSVGNLAWSGSGKTSLSLWLYERLSDRYKTAILRRGYGRDEGELLKESGARVFSAVQRSKLAGSLENSWELFILDDGFQHRKLARDVDIVMINSRDLCRRPRLIPAYFFREPLASLKRADILVVNYKDELAEDAGSIKESFQRIAPQLKIYFSQYESKGLVDLSGSRIDIDFLFGKKIAALTAIGYPQGFLNKLSELGLDVSDRIIYPDHHELSESEFNRLEVDLINRGINNLLITRKDKYHLPSLQSRLNIFILEVELKIDNESDFLKDIEDKLSRVGK